MLLLFGSLLASGCLTQKKREDVAQRWIRENPEKFAKEAALRFPVVVRPGVPVVKLDTTYLVKRDTTVKDSIVYITKDSISYIEKTIHLTDTIPDHALVESLMLDKFEVERKLYRSEVELEGEKERSKQRLWWLIGAIAAVTGVLGFNVYSFLKPGIKL